MKENQTRRNRLFYISVFIVLIVTLTPGNGNIAGNYLDKVAHFLIFFFLSINILFKYQKTNKLIPFLLWAILLGLVTEVIQQFIPGRGMDIFDAIADTLGVIMGYHLYQIYELKFEKMLLKLGA